MSKLSLTSFSFSSTSPCFVTESQVSIFSTQFFFLSPILKWYRLNVTHSARTVCLDDVCRLGFVYASVLCAYAYAFGKIAYIHIRPPLKRIYGILPIPPVWVQFGQKMRKNCTRARKKGTRAREKMRACAQKRCIFCAHARISNIRFCVLYATQLIAYVHIRYAFVKA